MRIVLQVKPAGRKTWLSQGQTVRVGRTDEADFVVPDDPQLAPAHFALRCEASECYVEDLDSGTGTRVNGEGVVDAVLNDGDLIEAGETTFVVQIQSSPLDSQLIPPELLAKVTTNQADDSDRLAEESQADKTQAAVVEIEAAASDRRLRIHPGEHRNVGRTHWADFSIENDRGMADVHFVVKCDAGECVIRSFDSAHTTFLNGQPITEATLSDGDRITAGETTFTVRFVGQGENSDRHVT